MSHPVAYEEWQIFPLERISLLFRKSPFLSMKSCALGHCAERGEKKRKDTKMKHLTLQEQKIIAHNSLQVLAGRPKARGVRNWKEEDWMEA